MNQIERQQLLNEIWQRMSELPLLRDFVDHGHKYFDYRNEYLSALLKMRLSLVPKGPRNRRGRLVRA
jgi:hypothetical protein